MCLRCLLPVVVTSLEQVVIRLMIVTHLLRNWLTHLTSSDSNEISSHLPLRGNLQEANILIDSKNSQILHYECTLERAIVSFKKYKTFSVLI